MLYLTIWWDCSGGRDDGSGLVDVRAAFQRYRLFFVFLKTQSLSRGKDKVQLRQRKVLCQIVGSERICSLSSGKASPTAQEALHLVARMK